MNKVFIVNRLYPIEKILGISNKDKNIRCLFHRDRRPSGHIYGNAYYCFTCGRFFYVSSIAFKKKIDIDSLYEELKDIYNVEKEEDFEKMAIIKKEIQNEDMKKLKIEKNINFIDFCKNYFNKKEEGKND